MLATIVSVMELTHIRVGNQEYAKENKSYGLTTMRNKHVEVHGAEVTFSFQGSVAIGSQRNLDRAISEQQDSPGGFAQASRQGVSHKRFARGSRQSQKFPSRSSVHFYITKRLRHPGETPLPFGPRCESRERPLAHGREAGRQTLSEDPGHGECARGAEDEDGRAEDGVGGY